MRHSPEPWSLYFGNGDTEIEIADANNVFVASLDSEVPEEYDHYNASRIVDCVNNCVGINPESIPQLLEAVCKLQMVVEEWIQSHDEENGPSPADWAKEILEFSRAAIAKATT